MPRDAHALWRAKVPKGTIVHKQATEKLHMLWFVQVKLRDSLLRLHIPGMVLFACGQELASYQVQEELQI